MPSESPAPNESRSEFHCVSHDLSDLELTQFELPITFLDRRRAEELILGCDPSQTNQIRLNALATLVVAEYCQYIGLVPDLSQSTLWQTAEFVPFDRTHSADRHNIADLIFEDGRSLECRPYWEGESEVFIPRSTWATRDGFLAIEISKDLSQAKIIGFLPVVNHERIPLNGWSDLNAFFEAFLPMTIEEASPRTEPLNRLDDWFADVMRSGWSTLAEVQAQLGFQTSELMPSFRSGSPDFGMASPVKLQAKLLKFPAIVEGKTDRQPRLEPGSESGSQTPFRGIVDSSPSTVDRFNYSAYTDEPLALETIQLGLLVKTRTLNEGLREVLLQILPPTNGQALPAALTVSLLDASGEVINHAKPKGNDSFGFRLALELGERCGICVALGQTEYTEYFLS